MENVVNSANLVARVKNILMTPKTEWPVISGESTSVADLYKSYILILAAIPAVFGFIKGSLIGYGAFGVHFRTGIGAGIASAVLRYVLSLVVVYVMALIIDALAPSFGGQKNQIQALKAAAYAWTASWIAGVGVILGVWLGMLIGLAGLIYSIYLLYLGLPNTMKSPAEKTGGYTAVSVIIGIVLSWIIGIVVAGVVGVGAIGSGAFSSGSYGGGSVEIDKDSSLGKFQAWSQQMEAASKKMEAAQKSGDAQAQGQALGAVMGAALGGGNGAVEALAPDVLKPFVPDTLAGLKRTEVSAERNGAMGMQVSTATGRYSDGAGHNLDLEVTDLGSAKGFLALAGFAGVEADRETDHGYDKTYKQDGHLVHEQWDSQSKHGEYSVVLGDRFTVKVSGNADSMDQLKAAVASLNLAGLEALKNQGVKNG